MRKVARLSDSDRRELFRNTADKMGINDALLLLRAVPAYLRHLG